MRTADYKLFPHRRDGGAGRAADAKIPAKELASVPAVLANAFGKLNLDRRARLLGRLLGSVGPLALVVVTARSRTDPSALRSVTVSVVLPSAFSTVTSVRV